MLGIGGQGGRGEKLEICGFWGFWGVLGVRRGSQGVHGGRGYVVTKFGLKRRHLDLIHTTFHDFAPFQAESKLNPG